MAKEFIVYSKTKAEFEALVSSGEVDTSQMGIIAETGEMWWNGEYRPIAETVPFANDLTGRIEATPEEFTFRPSAGDKSIRDESALIKKIKGNTIVWNQCINNALNNSLYGKTAWYVRQGAQNAEIVGNYVVINCVSGESSIPTLSQIVNFKKNHKYLIHLRWESTTEKDSYGRVLRCEMNNNVVGGTVVDYFTNVVSLNTLTGDKYIIKTAVDDAKYLVIAPRKYTNDIGQYLKISVNLFDLTQMFGAGNEPTTVEEFKALFPNSYYDYNAGELVSMTSNGLFANGFNQWDEEWVLGEFQNGSLISGNRICSKNFIKIVPNQVYAANKSLLISLYDSEKNFIPYDGNGDFPAYGNFLDFNFDVIREGKFPIEAEFIKFRPYSSYGSTTYKNDICINLSHTGVRNGEYEPYWDATKDLSIIQKYFPNGMRSAGSIYDEISFDETIQQWVAIQRVGSVDLGSLNWYVQSGYEEKGGFAAQVPSRATTQNIVTSILYSHNFFWSNFDNLADYVIYTSTNTKNLFAKYTNYTNASSFKTAMSGVMLYYELAEPIITTIEEPIDLSYKVSDFGIEKMLSDSFSAPFKADIIYQFNATDRVRENSMNISKLSKKHTLLESRVDREIANITTELEEVGENFFPLTGTLPANQIGEFKANTTNNGKEREWSLATAKIDYLRGNRLAFLQSSEFTIEHSYDNGATWTARGNTTQASLTLWADQPWGSPLSFGSSFTTGAMLRITIKPNSARQGLIEMLAIKFFENGGKFNIKVESNTSSAQDVWTEQCNVSPSTTTWCPTYLISYGKWLYGANNYHLRLTFTALNDGAKNSSLIAIGAYGLSTGVTTQVTPQLAMARLGHMYNWDYLQNVQFPNKVTASAFVKSGGTSSQILMADGSTKTDAGLSINYSQVGLNTYGQKVFAGVPVVLSPNIDVIRPNHLAFLQDDEYVVEKSDDSGETWYEVTKTDLIRQIFIGNNTGGLFIESAPEKMLRITIKPIGRYTQYEWLYLYTESPYNATNPPTTVTVEYSTGDAPDTWIGAVTAPINGQPAPNVVGLGVRNLGGSGSVGYGLRLTFQTTVTSTRSLTIYGIELHGTRIDTAKNNMMRWSHLYSTDASQNASFPAKVTATEFNTTNGKALTTDAQTLTADQKAQVATNLGGDTNNGLVRYVGGVLPLKKISAPDANGVEQTYVLPNASDEDKESVSGVIATEGFVDEGYIPRPSGTSASKTNKLLAYSDGRTYDSGVGVTQDVSDIANGATDSVPTSVIVKEYVDGQQPTEGDGISIRGKSISVKATTNAFSFKDGQLDLSANIINSIQKGEEAKTAVDELSAVVSPSISGGVRVLDITVTSGLIDDNNLVYALPSAPEESLGDADAVLATEGYVAKYMNDNLPTAVATATERVLTWSPTNSIRANTIYDISQSTTTALTIYSFVGGSGTTYAFDDVWRVRFAGVSSALSVVPTVRWENGIAPNFSEWAICDLEFRRLPNDEYIGKWTIYR